MAFSDSHFQAEALGAAETLREVGFSTRMLRKPDSVVSIPSAETGDTGEDFEEQGFDLSGVILDSGAQAKTGEQVNLEETFNRKRVLLCLTNPEQALPDNYKVVQAGDQFLAAGVRWKVIRVKEVNPDSQFPIIYDGLVG